MVLNEFKAYHKSLIGDKCTQAIYKGCDVETSIGTKHFSYTAEDRQNIQDLLQFLRPRKISHYHIMQMGTIVKSLLDLILYLFSPYYLLIKFTTLHIVIS